MLKLTVRNNTKKIAEENKSPRRISQEIVPGFYSWLSVQSLWRVTDKRTPRASGSYEPTFITCKQDCTEKIRNRGKGSHQNDDEMRYSPNLVGYSLDDVSIWIHILERERRERERECSALEQDQPSSLPFRLRLRFALVEIGSSSDALRLHSDPILLCAVAFLEVEVEVSL